MRHPGGEGSVCCCVVSGLRDVMANFMSALTEALNISFPPDWCYCNQCSFQDSCNFIINVMCLLSCHFGICCRTLHIHIAWMSLCIYIEVDWKNRVPSVISSVGFVRIQLSQIRMFGRWQLYCFHSGRDILSWPSSDCHLHTGQEMKWQGHGPYHD